MDRFVIRGGNPLVGTVAGRLGQRGDADERLQRLARLDRGAAAAAVADGVHVRPDLGDYLVLLAQRGDHGGPGLEAVEPLERAVRGDHAVLVHDGQAGQVVPWLISKSFGLINLRQY